MLNSHSPLKTHSTYVQNKLHIYLASRSTQIPAVYGLNGQMRVR